MEHANLTPVFVLICWSLLIWVYMYARRLPAMQKAGVDPQDAKHPGALSVLPSTARAAADNYNHLMEQPTIFYALAFYLHIAGQANDLVITASWGYVVLRIVHSLVQTTINFVPARFSLFALSTICLMVMASQGL